MGLRKPFTASDPLAYRLASEMGTFWLHYAPDLITPPRVYGEELTGLGAVWAGHDPNRYGPSSLSVLASMRQDDYPGWDITRWKHDGQEGRALSRDVGVGDAVMATYARFTVEPSGVVWWFGDPYTTRAVELDSATLAEAGAVIVGSDFGALTLPAFAVDRAADRVFMRKDTSGNRVEVFRLSTKVKLVDLWAPGEVRSIVLTHDGFVYLVDVLEWICCYDYEGRFRGALKATRAPAAPFGVIYGWDHYFKRLLRVVGTASATDGASTVRPEGFFPEPEAWELTPPLPLKVPRKGRSIYSFAHIAGEGGEPLGGRRLTVTADGASSTVAADANGDARAALTPDATGALLVEVTE